MNESNPRSHQSVVAQAVRRALLTAALSAAAVSVPGYAAAPAAESELEMVVITGSRIARTETESTNPVQVITAETIFEQGSQNVLDILEEMPAVGTSALNRQNSNFSSFGNGLSTINLRNAGDSRTLVLMNGRRVVAGLAGDSVVDLNNIPTDLLESVEVLTGGASATYGSEAIAGAINFRLKDSFDGLSLRAQGGMTTEGDNDRYMVSMTGGFNFLETGNFRANVTWDKDNGLRSFRREISAEDNPFRSSFSAQGLFAPTGSFTPASQRWTYDANNNLKQGFTNADGYNRNGDRFISVPMQRVLITTLADMPLSENTNLFFEGSYANYTTRARLEPQATDNSDATMPDGSPYAGLTIDNPYIPTAIRNVMIANNVTNLQFRKRWVGIADRSNQTDRDFYRYVVGLEGTVFSDWNWDAYALKGVSKDATRNGSGLRDRYFFALDGVAGPNGPMCRSAAARADGCVPMNLFGFNSVSQASVDYVTRNGTVIETYDARAEQTVAAANITGAIMDLPAGSWRVAAGVEYREEEAKQEFSDEVRAGNTLGNALSNTYGSYHVAEAYVETIIPLLSGLPMIQSLDVEGAFRYGDYSTVGGVNNWKAGLSWAPIESLRFRAVYANAVRAPNISELYAGLNQTFPAGIVDPCEGIGTSVTPPGVSAALASYCRSLPGFSQNAALNGGIFTYDPNADTQSIEGFDGGNPDLNEETAKTWTVGFVLTPTGLPGFTMTADWYDITIEDAVALVPRQFIVDQCVFSSGSSDLCGFITREGAAPVRPRSPGTLWQINSGPVNAAEIVTSGLDLTARYAFELGNGHNFNVGLSYTYVDELTLEPIKGEPIQDNVGQLNQYAGERLGSGFEHRAMLSLGYRFGGFSATWRTSYQSDMVDTLGFQPGDDEYLAVPAYWYHDANFRYAFGADETFAVYLGVDNVFDKKPPLINQNYAAWFPGTETSADSYDAIGRFVYVGFQVNIQ